MASIHIKLENGAAKCGVNVYDHYADVDGKWTFIEKRVRKGHFRGWLHFATPENPATCRRCLGTVEQRSYTAPIAGDMTGTIFHRSFGYNMTINIFAKVIGQTEKSLLVQEVLSKTNGEEHGYKGLGRATASETVKPDSKPFRMMVKNTKHGTHYSGGGEHWSVVKAGETFYENRVD